MPVGRQRGTSQYGHGPLVVVEDDRQPGTLWACHCPVVPVWSKTIELCTPTLAAALAGDVPEPGLVR